MMDYARLRIVALMLAASTCLYACGDSTINALATDSVQNKQPAAGMGFPGGGSGMIPGGLPPNFAEIKADYPEFAAALESMQDLAPEERFSQMNAIFEAHPEWQALMPAPGPGGPGGPGGTPPPNGGPPPGGGNSPMPQSSDAPSA